MNKFGLFAVLVGLMLCFDASAARNSKKPPEPPKLYKDSVRNALNEVAADELEQRIFPFSEPEVERLNETLTRKDAFYHAPKSKLQITNEVINVDSSPSKADQIPVIKLGHNFTTTLVFVDQEGRPWSADLLTDVSDLQAFSVQKKAAHIITVRGLKMAGEANLPILLKGEQYPVTLHFKISSDTAYFMVDVRAKGYGDNSRDIEAVSMYGNGERMPARYNTSDEMRDMLIGITPKGYKRHVLYDEYNDKASADDLMLWSDEDNIYLLTPYEPYTLAPTDIQVSPDGVRRLFVLPKYPSLYLKKYNKITLYRIKK